MCGRFASFLPAEAIARIFDTVNPLPNLAPSWNVAPTNDAAATRAPSRSAEVGPAALLDEGANPGPAPDQARSGTPTKVRHVPSRA